MSQVVYRCTICKRLVDPSKEDIHLFPDGTAYCSRCWSEWNRFAGRYGLDVVTE